MKTPNDALTSRRVPALDGGAVRTLCASNEAELLDSTWLIEERMITETVSPSTSFVPIADQIAEIARERPDSCAILTDSQTVTYAELISWARKMAAQFRLLNARHGDTIAVSTTDTVQMIVCALAAWHVGCAYLPIDPAWPRKRIEHILNEARISILALPARSRSALPAGGWSQIEIEGLPWVETWRRDPADPLSAPASLQPTDAAYIIYTSGSTGYPKGVAVSHGSLANLVDWYNRTFHLGPNDRLSQFAPLTFDVSVGEIFPGLAAGAAICVGDRRLYGITEELREFLVSRRITISQVATVAVEPLINLSWPEGTNLRSLQTGGDVLRVFPPSGLPFELVNIYGPTECTVLAATGVVPPGPAPGGMPSIGTPIQNTRIYILDRELNAVADGEQGEICIGGDCVSLGYIGRPDLTAEKFIEHPSAPKGTRIYKTGDVGRKRADGEYEFLGRIDNQIKIRGFRIEPNEVVNALVSHPSVASAQVTTTGEEAEKRLVAYVLLSTNCTADELRKHLIDRVPAYMLPELFVRVEHMPLSANDKIDPRRLPAPTAANILPATAGNHNREVSEFERSVIQLWKEALQVSVVGLDDDFFALGGTSLQAARLFTSIERTLGKRIPVSDILRYSTVRQQAVLLSEPNSQYLVDSLIPLRGTGKEKPLFLIHPISGNILSYRELVSELPERPIYGIQANPSYRPARLSIEGVAAEYIRELRRVQPTGPYCLAGYSAGGVITFEMARQLMQSGDAVDRLFLIDSWIDFTPGKLIRQSRLRDTRRLLFRNWRRDIRNIRKHGLPAYIHKRIRETALKRNFIEHYYRLASAWNVDSDSISALKTEAALRAATAEYSPDPLSIDTVLFRSCESRTDHIDSHFGWKEIVHGRLDVYDLPGEHHTILSAPSVIELAHILQNNLYEETGQADAVPASAAC